MMEKQVHLEDEDSLVEARLRHISACGVMLAAPSVTAVYNTITYCSIFRQESIFPFIVPAPTRLL